MLGSQSPTIDPDGTLQPLAGGRQLAQLGQDAAEVL
jgi:hypothetical protein